MSLGEYGFTGHAYTRCFYYSPRGGRGERQTFRLPGGIDMLRLLLDPEETPDSVLSSRAAASDLAGVPGYTEFFELQKMDGNREAFCSVRRLGYENGDFLSPYRPGKITVVWDQGLGAVELPPEEAPVFWASRKALPSPESAGRISFLILDADVLRQQGAMISRSISWERTVMNLLWQLKNNADISYLLACPRILVTFLEDGAVYLESDGRTLTSAQLLLTNGKSEGYQRSLLRGHVGDAFMEMVAATVRQFSGVLSGADLEMFSILQSGAMVASQGYSRERLCTGRGEAFAVSGDVPKPYRIELLPDGSTRDPDTYLIADTANEKDVLRLATRYVKGDKRALDGLPMLQIGNLKTVDRWEIEGFHNIRNIIEDYAAKPYDGKPLSIAVFGSPGSGKSFGVKQIAKDVLKVSKADEKDVIQVYNVSQFQNLQDLGHALQQVRDAILKGHLPLVFFNEFDAGDLQWLGRFLMPMQDGEFSDGGGIHPLGKCILVFAGGTASSFRDFSNPTDPERFRRVKGPDFVSRIKGSLDIAGPNQRSSDDTNYILRRALLLRSLCDRDKRLSGPDAVDDDIVRAMLLVPKYKHGARSMETVLAMSQIPAGKWVPSSLPMGELLSIHVPLRSFTDLLLLDIIENSVEGRLGRWIHEGYCRRLDGGKSGGQEAAKSSLQKSASWDELLPHYKISNINQAKSYPEKLDLIGCVMEPRGERGVEAFTDNEIDVMAAHEHRRWSREKEESGWVYAPIYHFNKKHSPFLVEWDALTDERKEGNREFIRGMLANLDAIGYAVYRK